MGRKKILPIFLYYLLTIYGKRMINMKNKIPSLLLVLILSFMFTGCGLLNKIFHGNNPDIDVVYGTDDQIMKETSHVYTTFQLDSMCVADTLPRNLNEWLGKSYTDSETKKRITKYMYIKRLTDTGELIYIVTPRENLFSVKKRSAEIPAE